jgi:hypothetical protein
MLFTTALLVIYGTYAMLIGSIEDSWPLLAGGMLAAVASYGTAMVRPWSKYFVYTVTVGFAAKVGLSVHYAVKAGFFLFQFGTPSDIAISLLPSFFMCALGVACCIIVQRQFRTPPR